MFKTRSLFKNKIVNFNGSGAKKVFIKMGKLRKLKKLIFDKKLFDLLFLRSQEISRCLGLKKL